jgi:hypothetical protein
MHTPTEEAVPAIGLHSISLGLRRSVNGGRQRPTVRIREAKDSLPIHPRRA